MSHSNHWKDLNNLKFEDKEKPKMIKVAHPSGIAALSLREREEWIFADPATEEERILMVHEYLFGYNPLSLPGKVVSLKLPSDTSTARLVDSSMDIGEELNLGYLRRFSFIPSYVTMDSPDDCSTFEIAMPAIKLSASLPELGRVEVAVSSVFSNYVSWIEEKHPIHWKAQFAYKDAAFFELKECELKVSS